MILCLDNILYLTEIPVYIQFVENEYQLIVHVTKLTLRCAVYMTNKEAIQLYFPNEKRQSISKKRIPDAKLPSSRR